MQERQLTTLEIPDISDINLSHTLNQFFLSCLVDLQTAKKSAIEPTFSVGGNVFKCRFELLRVISVAPPATEENEQ